MDNSQTTPITVDRIIAVREGVGMDAYGDCSAFASSDRRVSIAANPGFCENVLGVNHV